MKAAEYIDTLRHEGELLAGAAEQAGWDAAVPPCPGWVVRDLVHHTGSVHRWAAGYVAGSTTPVPIPEEAPAPDGELAAWYREGHRELVERLMTAPAGLECWTFLKGAASPLEFWARRQAHETAVHRVDAQAAAGTAITPIDPEFAADGVDELLTGFHTRSRSRVRSAVPLTLRVRAAGRDDEWLVRLSDRAPEVERGGSGAADCTVTGPATDLYLALWNRAGTERLEVAGDSAVLELWRRTSGIT